MSGPGGTPERVAVLEEARRREKVQTLFYRALAARAEDEGRHEAAERLNALHADEQHHLSRLTARLIEDGIPPAELRGMRAPDPGAGEWEAEARERERDEVAYYRGLLEREDWDRETRAVLEEIFESEEHHARELGGKWMAARPPAPDEREDER